MAPFARFTVVVSRRELAGRGHEEVRSVHLGRVWSGGCQEEAPRLQAHALVQRSKALRFLLPGEASLLWSPPRRQTRDRTRAPTRDLSIPPQHYPTARETCGANPRARDTLRVTLY